MLDTILEIGSIFDWISPLAGLVGDIAHGPSHTFLIPYGCGWSGRTIARLLKDRGIKSWGHMIVDGRIMITVRERQAHWAQYVLDQAGIATETPFLEKGAAKSVRSRSQPRRRAKDGPAGALDEILDMRLF